MKGSFITVYKLEKVIVKKCISHMWITTLVVHADSLLKLVTENFI